MLFATAVLPALLLLLYFWERDDYRTSRKRVIGAFLAGMVACIPAALTARFLLLPFVASDELGRHALERAFFTAAIPEETAKWLVVLLLVSGRRAPVRAYDVIMTAIAVSIGFAALENVLYVAGAKKWALLATARGISAVPGHVFYGAVMGTFLCSRRHFGVGPETPLPALFVPVMMHGLYNFFAHLNAAYLRDPSGMLQESVGDTSLGFTLVALVNGIIAISLSGRVIARDRPDGLPFRAGGANAAGPPFRRLRAALWMSLSVVLLLSGGLVLLAAALHVGELAQSASGAGAYPARNHLAVSFSLIGVFFGIVFCRHALQVWRRMFPGATAR